jgi:ankyrin repeat protein
LSDISCTPHIAKYVRNVAFGTEDVGLLDPIHDVDFREGRSSHTDVGAGYALQVAAKFDFERVVKLLVNAGADVNVQGRFHTPLAQVATSGHVETARLLLYSGVDINQPSRGYMPLQLACDGGHEALVRLLIGAGANVNARTQSQYKAYSRRYSYDNSLQSASGNGFKEIIKLLLDNGADVNAQSNTQGDPKLFPNAFQAAFKGDHGNIVKLLLEYNTDLLSLVTG